MVTALDRLYRTMSQLVRIQGEVFHVPSIARTRLYSSTFLGCPVIKIVIHSGQEYSLRYKARNWIQANQDFKKLEMSRAACQEALKSVPLMAESEVANPLVESEKKLQ